MLIKPKTIEELVKAVGLLKEDQIKKAQHLQRDTRERMGVMLMRLGYIHDEKIYNLVVSQLAIKPELTQALQIDPEVLNKIPRTFAHNHRIIPIRLTGKTLTIATDSPYNFLAFDNLKYFFGYNIEGVLTPKEDIDELLHKYYIIKEGAPIDAFVAKMDDGKEISYEELTKERAAAKEEGPPLIKLVSLVIAEAVRKRASDIHVEPLEDRFRIRYRVDGVLQEAPGPPKRLFGSVASRIKIMAGMDISEKRLPQDGRIRIEIGGRELDLRVSTLPAFYGESIVLRILDKSRYLLNLKDLGFLLEDEKKFKKLIKMPNGILLVTGPTGSGKTTTLYGSLNFINRPDRKLITIEDPVEYQITGINQVQVRPQINLTFASGLRSILRQSPDVIMVGEIRDFETAQIAIQAALTGHLVFSTLHTNDAPGAITRLIDMGIKPYLVASAVQAVLAQRLVRVVCPSCKEEYQPLPEELKAIEMPAGESRQSKLYRGKGCKECSNTGYRGRIGIFELLIMSDKIRELVFEMVPSSIIKKRARELGMLTLREDGIRKAFKGITTIAEVMRVTQQDIA